MLSLYHILCLACLACLACVLRVLRLLCVACCVLHASVSVGNRVGLYREDAF